MTIRLVSKVLLVVGTFSASGCHREVTEPKGSSVNANRFAEQVCAAATKCDCASPFADQDACQRHHREAFGALEDTMTLDEDCLDQFLRVLDESPCAVAGTPDWGMNPGQGALCFAFVGDNTHGDSCSQHREVAPLAASDCRSELRCAGGTCVEGNETTPLVLHEGDQCDEAATPTCNSSDLFCDSGVCRPGAAVGEPCTSAWGCHDPDGGLPYCEFDSGTCVPKRPIGESCDPHDLYPCINLDPEDSSGLAHCDPGTGACVAGRAPAICEGVSSPASTKR